MESKKINAQKDGAGAELRAKQYLESKGLTFIESNYKVKVGEIDLIFLDIQQIVFVEVKYRASREHGSAAEQFTRSKRSKLIKAMQCYLQKNGLNYYNTSMRIDLIAIDSDNLNWIKNV